MCYSSGVTRQLELELPKWGGRRKGAGRPRTQPHPGLVGEGVPHLQREDFAARHPVHVTIRVQPGVGYLRSQSRAQIIRAAIDEMERFGVRVIDYSIQGNHLHLIVEAQDAAALSRGMQSLGIRIAKRLNALSGRHGGVLADRYHAHVLRSRREVANAVRYVLRNYRHHAREYLPPRWEDPFSAHNRGAPASWLLRAGPAP
jgi:REP element-mobilizing transposase RayT